MSLTDHDREEARFAAQRMQAGLGKDGDRELLAEAFLGLDERAREEARGWSLELLELEGAYNSEVMDGKALRRDGRRLELELQVACGWALDVGMEPGRATEAAGRAA